MQTRVRLVRAQAAAGGSTQANVQDLAIARQISLDNFVETWGHSYPPADLAAYLDEHYAEQAFAKILVSEQYALFLLEQYQAELQSWRAIGHCLCGPNALPHRLAQAFDLELKRLYLLRAFHNLGLGQQLMAMAMQWLLHRATLLASKHIWVGVWSENFAAQRFYQRYGFNKVGEYDFQVGNSFDHEFIFCLKL